MWNRRGGVEILKKPNFIITIRYEIQMFSSIWPSFWRGGGGPENFGQKLKFWGFFQLRWPLNGCNHNLMVKWTYLVPIFYWVLNYYFPCNFVLEPLSRILNCREDFKTYEKISCHSSPKSILSGLLFIPLYCFNFIEKKNDAFC